MKALVAVKRVPDGNAPLRLKADGSGVDLAGMPMRINPFDEAALEAAVQWKEASIIQEIVAISIGNDACLETLRHALALGADRAIHIATDATCEPLMIAQLLRAIAEHEQPDLLLLGKQSSDDDNAQTAPMLAALLGWPQGVFASALVLENGRLQVTREIEGGQEILALPLPAVISADLRLAVPRYLKLPQLLQAKKKSIETLASSDLVSACSPRLVLQKVSPPAARRPARQVADVAELLACLQAEGLLLDAAASHEPVLVTPLIPKEPLQVAGCALILAEHSHGKLHPSVRHTISAACLLATDIVILVAGSAAAAVEAASIAGVSRVLLADAPHFEHALAEDLAALLAQTLRDLHASALLAAATPFGKAILPRTAALLDSAMLTDVVEIRAPDVFVRPIHAGEALATLNNLEPIKILSVRPAAFPSAANQAAAPIEMLDAPATTSEVQWCSTSRPDSARPLLTDARIVVAGGRGLGTAEQFQALLEPLADRLNAAIGATRAAVDAGFIGNDHQVGQTGAIVAPEFYFALGLSGAAQHLAGMRDARIIVAINKDPAAPICKHADFVLNGDVSVQLPALLELLG